MDHSSSEYQDIMAYIDRGSAAVIATINDDGTPHSAVVYVVSGSNHTAYFVTKDNSRKYKNIAARPDVSLVMFDERESSTLQVIGKAFVSTDEHMIHYVLDKIKKEHAIQAEWLPPVMKLKEGGYAVVGVEIIHARLAQYAGIGISEPRFTVI